MREHNINIKNGCQKLDVSGTSGQNWITGSVKGENLNHSYGITYDLYGLIDPTMTPNFERDQKINYH